MERATKTGGGVKNKWITTREKLSKMENIETTERLWKYSAQEKIFRNRKKKETKQEEKRRNKKEEQRN